MKALIIHDAEDIVFALQDEIRRSDEARYDHRLHALLLVAQGMSCRQAAQWLGDAPRTIAYWVNRFENEGFAGLVDAERSGRPCRLDSGQLAELEFVLRGEPREHGFQGLWDGKTLSAFVEQRWGIALGVRQCQRLFRRFGFRLRKPRSKIANADSGMQMEYKKLKIFHDDDNVDLWALDEVRFEQHGTRCRMWIPPEIKEP
jgi:transposase